MLRNLRSEENAVCYHSFLLSSLHLTVGLKKQKWFLFLRLLDFVMSMTSSSVFWSYSSKRGTLLWRTSVCCVCFSLYKRVCVLQIPPEGSVHRHRHSSWWRGTGSLLPDRPRHDRVLPQIRELLFPGNRYASLSEFHAQSVVPALFSLCRVQPAYFCTSSLITAETTDMFICADTFYM